jgi:RNA polymerase sigma factor (sigma-70 family)
MAVTTTVELQGDQVPDGPSDAALLERVREGDQNAYGELYVRHEPAATSLARYLTRSNHEADDVVADAFARVLRAIKGGAGPTESFRPYLLTAVRRTVWRHAEESNHHRLAATEDEAELLDLRLAVEPEDRTDEGIILRAFQELPERWQLVLWHTEIEGQPPAEVAPLLGLSPNATAALAVRAREGLRQAFLQAHLQARPAESCRFSVEHLGSFVRDGLGKRDNAKVEAHLAECEECRELQGELGSLNKALRSIVGPAVLGGGGARWLQTRAAETSAGTGTIEHARQVVHRLRFPQAVGLAGVAAALFITLGVSSDLGRPPEPADAAGANAVPISEVVLPNQVVDAALTGTTPRRGHGVQQRTCTGASLPLSLPDGAVPTGAALVEPDGAATEPTVVDPDTAAGYRPVPTDGAVLVGDGGACVSNLIEPLADAPANTALVVSFLDQLGNLQILVVPQIVDTIQTALDQAVALVDSANQQLRAYLDAVAAQLQLAGGAVLGPDGLVDPDGLLPGGGSGAVPSLPDVPAGGGTPTLPSVPPAVTDPVGTVGGTVDDVVGGVTDTVDGLVCGLLGCH